MRAARGAIMAASRLPSTGRRSSRPEKKRRRGTNHVGKLRVVLSIPSPKPRSPESRHGSSPPTPVLPAITAAMRSSMAVAMAAILPSREYPNMATCFMSTWGSVSR